MTTSGDLGEQMRAFAFGLPEAWEDHPWGDTVAKVGRKVFAFLGMPGENGQVHVTVKLRDSHEEASSMTWVTPARHGLDRGGWVSCTVPADVPIDLLTGWIEESYRLVAPKRLIALLAGREMA